MCGAPYFPFYAQDWLEDVRIFGLSLESEGAYIRLLAAMWVRGGSVPDDDKWLCNSLRCTKARLKAVRAALIESENPLLTAADGVIFSVELREKFEKLHGKLEKLRVNGKKGGENRAKKANEINESVKQLLEHGLSNINKDKDKDVNTSLFIESDSRIFLYSNDRVDSQAHTTLQFDGGEFVITEDAIGKFGDMYQALNVEYVLSEIASWLSGNRKRFEDADHGRAWLHSWLRRENEAVTAEVKGGLPKARRPGFSKPAPAQSSGQKNTPVQSQSEPGLENTQQSTGEANDNTVPAECTTEADREKGKRFFNDLHIKLFGRPKPEHPYVAPWENRHGGG